MFTDAAPMRIDGTLSIPFLADARSRSECDQGRLRRAFDQNYAGVWRFLRRMGVAADRADDAAQQVFLIALEALPRIADGSERAFLYGTAIRLAHGIRRKADREVPSVALDFDPSPLPSPDQLADQKRAREVLDAIISSLDVDVRTVFVLSEFDGFTTPEIASLLDIPLGTAASRLRRAREKFQQLVRTVFGEEP
jgi:RNA polymerase sigma-70 factor (ECF subfamily)